MGMTRSEILAKAADIPTKEVDVPEWGEKVRLRCLSAKQRLDWSIAQSKALAGEAAPDPTAYLIVLAAVDDKGARIFQTQDVDWIAEMRGDVINELADQVLQLSGLAEDAAKDAEGNSEATPSGDSPSVSLESSDEPSPS